MIKKVEHYYIKNPRCKRINYQIKTNAFGISFIFKTVSGVYSPKRVDLGSIIHLKHANLKNTDKILDLGCGYGTVGIIIKKLHPRIQVYMSDINQRAIDCAKENIKLNNIKAKVFQSDGFENVKDCDFNVVLFNPPIQAGLKICYRLLAESFTHLKIGGTLQVVLRPREGGKSILKKMQAIFGNLKELGNEGIYVVYSSEKKTKEPISEYNKLMAKK